MRAGKKVVAPSNEAGISRASAANADVLSQGGRSNSVANAGLQSLGIDAKSQRSYRPHDNVNMMVNPFDNSKSVLFEDPSAALNLTEEKWNAIVQENRRKFEAEKVTAKAAKLERNKLIQQEQLRQMEARKKIIDDKKVVDRSNFNSVGIRSSDVYYVNEDKKSAAMAALKGGSRHVAEGLRS